MAFCGYCGVELLEGAKYCQSCGAAVIPAEPVAAAAAAAAPAATAKAVPAAMTSPSPVSGTYSAGVAGSGAGFGVSAAPSPTGGAYPANTTGAPIPVPAPVASSYEPGVSGVATGTKSRTVAAVLAILLGGLGVHKFYMGKTTAGLIMLGALVLLSFAGFGAAVSLLGLIEGIIYLTKSDEDWQRIYFAENKDWL